RRSRDFALARRSASRTAARPPLRRRKRRARTSDRAPQAGGGTRPMGGGEALTLYRRRDRVTRVGRIDQILVPLFDLPALHFERRRELAGLDRKVVLEQHDLLRRLELREI